MDRKDNMKLKICYFFLAYCTLNPFLNGSSKIQSKANQIHAQIQALLEDFSSILPEQSAHQVFDINDLELQENKQLSIEEMQNFLLTLQRTTQHLDQLSKQYQHQENVISQHKNMVQQLIKIAQWLHKERTLEAWDQYASMHEQTCATIQKNLLVLQLHPEFYDICLQVGQSIINSMGILILQLHHGKQHEKQIKFFARAYRDFMNLFNRYNITTYPAIHDIVTSLP